jgi:NitT/TauT family transport system permease protein
MTAASIHDSGPVSSRDLVRRLVAAARLRYWLIQLAAFVAFLIGWQGISIWSGADIVPGPGRTVPRLIEFLGSGRSVDPLAASLGRTALGFAAGFSIGIAYGVAAGRSPRFRRATSIVFQLALFMNTLVIIFWGLAIFGNTNEWAVVVVASLTVFPPVGVYVRDVVAALETELVEMATSFHASRWQRAWELYLPFLVPALLATARVAFSLTWKIVLLAEVFGLPSGLGWQIQQSYSAYNLTDLMAWLGVFVLALLLVEQGIRAVERRVVVWA